MASDENHDAGNMAKYDVSVIRKVVSVQRQTVSVQASCRQEAREVALTNINDKRWINVRQLGHDYQTEIKTEKKQ